MELHGSNTNFGMAFRSPARKSMPYFRQFLANANPTGNIDTKALGEFIIKQSNNQNVELCYKHTVKGDVLHIFEKSNPKNLVKVPCKNTPSLDSKDEGFVKKIIKYFNPKADNLKYDHTGDWNNLPEELKRAGEISDKMEKEILKRK